MKIIIKILLKLIVGILALAVFAVVMMKLSVKNIKRVSDDGVLYYFDYTGSYNNALIRAPYRLMSSGGCSAFVTQTDAGDTVTGRNYDMPHKDSNGNLTGLNAVFRLNPKDGYRSINVADLSWLSKLGVPYVKGALDDGKTTKLLLAFAPYLAMDGMNEKGLTSSILYLDVKEGEKAVMMDTAGKKKVSINEMNRFIIDYCATVDEAVALAETYNMCSILGNDYHLFVTDADGNAAVLEWRYNTLKVTYTNACTNFYVGYDDAEDCYYGTELKEAFTKAESTTREYHYGYGHGYGRFQKLAETLDAHITDSEKCTTVMTQNECMRLLQDVSQEFTGELTSYTQFSCVYNQTKLTLDIASQMDYDNIYHFNLTE